MTTDRRTLAALLALLALAASVYWPGLSGGFLFDDFVNLDALGATGPVDDPATFLRYLTSGTADPTGRPLALLSFLLDARDWPANPGPFLRTNLALHLLNGVLLFFLLAALDKRLDGGQRVSVSALLGAGIWLLHPLLVSTTLYVVQREAMLPATFILVGLLCFLRGRALLARDARRGAAWMILGIAGGTVLATLGKANGLLLPLLAWVIDATVPEQSDRGTSRSLRWRRLHWLLVVLPSLALFAYLASFLPRMHADLPGRDWTIAERVLTEPRVLVEYLRLLVVPRSVSTGLYNDAFQVSSGWLSPPSTLAAALLVLALPIGAWCVRKRAPALAAALLFFVAGHLLESSVIPLELYFEHRNYVPALLLGWPLARLICNLPRPESLRIMLAVFVLGLLAATTFQRARLWGQPDALATLWARQNPGSSRAQVTLAMNDAAAGRTDQAMRRLAPAWQSRPDDLQLALNYVSVACTMGGLPATDAQRLEAALSRSGTAAVLVEGWLARSIDAAAARECAGVGLDEVARWIAAAESNPAITGKGTSRRELHALRAHLAVQRGQRAEALRRFDLALDARPDPGVAASQASTLARGGHYREALAHLDHYERIAGRRGAAQRGMPQLHRRILEWQGYWPHEFSVLRGKLQAELRNAGDITPEPRAPR